METNTLKPDSDKWRHGTYYACLLLAQVMVGINITGSKYLLLHLPELFLLFIRFALGSLLLLALHCLLPKQSSQHTSLKQLTRQDWWFIIGQALCAGVLFNLLLLLGLHLTSASMAGVITSALPAMVALLSVVFLNERLTRRTGLSIFLSVLGLVVINLNNLQGANLSGFLGDGLILLSLIPEAIYYVLARLHHPRLPIFKLSALINAINVPICLVLVFAFHAYPQETFTTTLVTVLLMVGASSGFFYVFWGIGAKHVPGSTASVFTALMPITTLLMASIFLHESISATQSVGMTLVILAIVISARKPKPLA